MIEVIEQSKEFKESKGTEVSNHTTLKPSLFTESKPINTDSVDIDFRDFIKGNISMDELFKKRELENVKN